MPKKILNEFDIISKYNQKMSQKRLVLDRKYAKMLGLRKEKLEYKKAREIERIENKWKKCMERDLHNLTHKRQRKEPVDKTIGKLKAKALTAIQRYAKLKRAIWSTKWPMIFLVDKMKRVELNKTVHWWHCYPQSNYRWMMFNIRNILPISSRWNKKQLDTIGDRIVNLPKEEQEYLKEKSKEKKSEKRNMRDRKFYQEIIEKYEALNKVEEERLGILSLKKSDARA